MLLLIRRLKQGLFLNSEMRKYLLYALGEMVLVVIGILIALNIDNWNEARKNRETLDSYLHSISRNIAADLTAVEAVRARREEAFQSATQIWALADLNTDTDAEAVSAAYSALLKARAIIDLQTNDSGYEAMKSSGNLDQLQGTDLEALLYDYYDTIGRIESAERNYNEYARQLWLNVLNHWSEGLSEWEAADPTVLTVQRFGELQPEFRQLLMGTYADALYLHAGSTGPLLQEYQRLKLLGSALVHLVDAERMDLDAAAASILDGMYDPAAGIGYPTVVEDGRVVWRSYSIIAADSNLANVSYVAPDEPDNTGPKGLSFNSIQWRDDSMHIDYPGGARWAGIWIVAGQSGTTRTSLDFSSFDTLALELKGDSNGDTVFVELQDRDDVPDGTLTQVELRLSDQWQRYEIDLSRFETADAAKLRVVTGFVFYEQPASFSVRSISYLETN